ncbi:MAG TPA: V-type ATP synthase subunit D [Methanomicrobiales archaeon]|nr:V-type ATP synthase subunit D [Methanomicrobiales archaeon]
MAEQASPTRMELIRKKAQIRLARAGRDLLREKMDALIREFFRTMESVSRSRGDLEGTVEAARHSLTVALAVDDPVAVRSASFAAKRGIVLDIRGKNVMGVPVPVIEKKRVARSVLERGYGITGVSGRIDEVAERYEQALDLVIILAETETALQRLGGEIRMTRRRVNALEQVVIPSLERQAKAIETTIGEREREDLFRLKRVKRIIERKRESPKEGQVS